MTLVHGNLPPVRAKADDGAALQRRLLQDLERQWLDSWGVADQLQAQAAPPEPPSAEEAPQPDPGLPLAGAASHAEPDVAHALAPRSTPSSRHAALGCGQSPAGMQMPQRLTAVEQGPSMAAPAPPVDPATPVSPAQAAQVAQPARIAQPVQPVRPAPADQLATPSANAMASVRDAVPKCAPPPVALAAHVAAVSMVMTPAGAVFSGAASSSPNPSADAAPPIQAMSPGAGAGPDLPLQGQLAQAPHAEGAQAEPAASAVKPRTQPCAPDAEPGPRHLMLRELDDQHVLASMRDADLGSAESRIAAQGLAHALMEAGYARVQVVVNGQRHERTVPSSTAARHTVSNTADAELSSPLTSQESRHGH